MRLLYLVKTQPQAIMDETSCDWIPVVSTNGERGEMTVFATDALGERS